MAINLETKLRNGESSERLIKRFIKKVKKEKILEKYREKLYYKKPSEIKRERKKHAIRKRQIEDLKKEN